LLPVSHGVASNQASAGGGLATISMTLNNLGPTLGGLGLGSHNTSSVALMPVGQTIANNNADTLALAYSISSSSTIISSKLTVECAGVGPALQMLLSSHITRATNCDVIGWMDNLDPASYGSLGGAIDPVLQGGAPSDPVLDVVASTAAQSGAVPNTIFFVACEDCQGSGHTGALPPPKFESGDVIKFELEVTNAAGPVTVSSTATFA
tara:strand:- start:11017 stop:11640 length:624 start_codon:yes stop_codon:yes gene_type:complete